MTSPASIPGDRVRVQTFVHVPPNQAFDVFTGEIDTWWRRSPRFRLGTKQGSTLRFEGEAGGRLVEVLEGGREHFIGKVLAWERGARLCFEWRAVNFSPSEVTEVEVLFEPGEGGTRVTLEHRGWSRIPRDHAVRHGQVDAEFVARLGTWWGALATSYRETAED